MERPLDLGAETGPRTRTDGVLWGATAALAIGALLGALTSTRYDLMFGLPEPLYVALRSVVFAAAWTYAGLQPADLHVGRIGG
jgi:hypothetical protein